MITQENISIAQRITAPKPKIFKILQVVGGTLATIGATLATAPLALPAVVVTIGGYLFAAGTVAGTVATLPVDFDKLNAQAEQNK